MEVVGTRRPLFLEILEGSQVGEARRRAMGFAQLCGGNEAVASRAGIIVTELANNLLHHAANSYVVIQKIDNDHAHYIEILSIDRGPGIANIEQSMQDGYSTSGTPGNGLGAIRRLSDEFDVYSVPQVGTVIMSRLLLRENPSSTVSDNFKVKWGAYCRPAPGEIECGDTWRVESAAERMRFMVADGLGHGTGAAEAADLMAETFEQNPTLDPSQLLTLAHRNGHHTRGAAVAVAELHQREKRLRYAGVGNIAGVLIDGDQSKGLFSHNGTVGLAMRNLQTMEYTWPEGGLFIMHSDGIQSRWSLSSYPGLRLRHPSVIAATLARDFARGRDDITVLVVMLNRR